MAQVKSNQRIKNYADVFHEWEGGQSDVQPHPGAIEKRQKTASKNFFSKNKTFYKTPKQRFFCHGIMGAYKYEA